jgi:hypothetical protein
MKFQEYINEKEKYWKTLIQNKHHYYILVRQDNQRNASKRDVEKAKELRNSIPELKGSKIDGFRSFLDDRDNKLKERY